MPSRPLVVYCTCPDQACADRIAEALLSNRFAACVSAVPGITSTYIWRGKQETSRETLLMIKTQESRYKDVESAVVSLHPYELPELVAVPVIAGLSGYLDWIEQCTRTPD